MLMELVKVRKLMNDGLDPTILKSLHDNMLYDVKHNTHMMILLGDHSHDDNGDDNASDDRYDHDARYLLHRDLLKGRIVIYHDPDYIHDAVSSCHFEYVTCFENIKGTADVVQTDNGPRLVNKVFEAPVKGEMFYDHYPYNDDLWVDEDGKV